MTMRCYQLIGRVLFFAATVSLPSPAFAQGSVETYPAKSVRVVVALAPGGGTDIQARMFSQKLSENLGRQFVVDNRAGAGGTIAYALVADSQADGYTLLAVASGFTITPALYEKLPYDPIKDFAPISLVTEAPFLLLTHRSVAVNSTRDLIELARAKPGALNFASGGQGTSLHLALELFKFMAKLDIVHVPYKGGGPALTETLAGHVHGTFSNILSSLPYLKSGQLRALALTSAKRSSVLPDLPTVSESGVPGYVTTAWHGWLAPKGTPIPLVNRLSMEIAKVVKSPDIAGRLVADGGEAIGSTPERFRQLIATEIASFRKVVKERGLRIE